MLARHVFAFPLIAALSTCGLPARAQAPTPTPVNLVANPSFESVGGRQPTEWAFSSGAAYLHATDTDAYQGKRSVLVDVPAGIQVHPAAEQYVRVTPGTTYELSAWVKVVEARGGAVMLRLEWADRSRQRIDTTSAADSAVAADSARARQSTVTNGWTRLVVSGKAPPRAAFAHILVPYVTGGLLAYVDLVRLVALDELAVGAVRPRITNLETRATTATTARLAWDSNVSRFEVLYRKLARRAVWQTESNIYHDVYTLIDLEPDTQYDVKIRALPEQILDDTGQPVDRGLPFETAALRIRTQALESRLARKLTQWPPLGVAEPGGWAPEPNAPNIKLWPSYRLGTSRPDEQPWTSSRMEEYKDEFYVVQCSDAGIFLTMIRPSDLKPQWAEPKLLVAPVTDAPTSQGNLSTVVFRDKLWLMWTRRPAGAPRSQVTNARQMLLSCDLATGKVSEPIVLDATKPGVGTWQGSLAVWNDRLWLLWTEAWTEGDHIRARMVIASYTPDAGLGKPAVWDACPTAYPYAPSLTPFESDLIVLFSDRAVGETTPGQEPLMCVRFNGSEFHDLQTIQGLGRNRRARSVQVADSLYAVYESNTEWMQVDDTYSDIAFTRVGPQGRMIETLWYVDDMKGNLSPDIVAYKNSLYVIYTKYDRAPEDPRYPAKCRGTYMGKIDIPQ